MPRGAPHRGRAGPGPGAGRRRAPWGRAQWERLAEGQLFDGMESWLPWLCDDERVLPDLLGAGAQVVLVDPRRMRDRAAELLDEEAALAGALAVTWGVVDDGDDGEVDDGGDDDDGTRGTSPACTCPTTACSSGARPRCCRMVPVADVAGDPGASRRRAGSRSTATGPGWPPGCGALAEGGYSVTVCAEGAGSADRLAAVLAEEGMVVPVVRGRSTATLRDTAECRRRAPTWHARAIRGSWWPRSTGASWCRRPRWRCWPRPTSPGGGGPTARPGPGPGRSTGSSTTWRPGTTWCTASTAWPATGGW